MTAPRRDRHSAPRWIRKVLPYSVVVLIVGSAWDLSLPWDEECTKRRPLGNHHVKPQADLVGGRQLSRDLWLLPTGLCRRPGRQAHA